MDNPNIILGLQNYEEPYSKISRIYTFKTRLNTKKIIIEVHKM